MKELKRCKRCLLPETFRFISFDKKGVCNYCELILKQKKVAEKIKSDKTFRELISKYKGKTKHEAVIGLSGGKDSCYLLYLMKYKYGLNPLSVSFDTRFMSETAKKNINNTENIEVGGSIASTPGFTGIGFFIACISCCFILLKKKRGKVI